MKFKYRSGQQPLDGFTLKRGVGQGGFGEVYFAVSDGGKEVALKLLLGHSEVELRGIANCLNMKHPNLVHVYDLREDSEGQQWLVMEYVLGETMSAVLNRHPTGLPLSLTKEWFAALARAVGHLHDRGVVHRDLKPANIFVEAGTLKVGDYGLCKTISTSQRQTRTVGTVHYMAPEVSTGNYSQKIDQYACGVILHEMLTGKIPFDGESDGEILMKHLTATPDLTGVPEPFRPIIAKALDKNPNKRYASMAEMAKAVEPIQLPQAVPIGVRYSAIGPVAAPPGLILTPDPELPKTQPIPERLKAPPIPAKVAEKTPLPVARPVRPPTIRDRLTGLLGGMLAAPIIAALGLVPYGLLSNPSDWTGLMKLFLVSTALSWAVLLGSGQAAFRSSDGWSRRLRLGILGLGIGAFAFWLDGWTMPRAASSSVSNADSFFFGTITMPSDVFSTGVRYVLYFGGVMAAGRWWRAAARDRKERFSLFPLLAAGFWSAALLFLWPWEAGSPATGIVPIVLAIVAVQAVSPWTPSAKVQSAKKLRLGRA